MKGKWSDGWRIEVSEEIINQSLKAKEEKEKKRKQEEEKNLKAPALLAGQRSSEMQINLGNSEVGSKGSEEGNENWKPKIWGCFCPSFVTAALRQQDWG